MRFGSRNAAPRCARSNSLASLSLGTPILTLFLPFERDLRDRAVDFAKRITGRRDEGSQIPTQFRPEIRLQIGILVNYLELQIRRLVVF